MPFPARAAWVPSIYRQLPGADASKVTDLEGTLNESDNPTFILVSGTPSACFQ